MLVVLSWAHAVIGLAAGARKLQPRCVSPAFRRVTIVVARDAAREKLIKGGLPEKFADRVSFQSGGQKKAGQEDEILVLWKEFKRCYKSETVALQMLSKNTAVILPQLNSPRKIKGAPPLALL